MAVVPLSSLGPWLPRAKSLSGFRNAFFLSKEERKAKREELYKEISAGHFSEFHEFRKNNSKRFIAPNNLCSGKEAVMFPSFTARSLRGDAVALPSCFKGHSASIVLLFMRALGMTMCEQYRKPLEKVFKNVPIFEVSVIEGLVFRLLRSILEKNLRKQVDSERHASFLSYYGNFSDTKEKLKIHSSIIGYAFLIDDKGRIRWRCHGYPIDKEIDSLIKCTKELLAKE